MPRQRQKLAPNTVGAAIIRDQIRGRRDKKNKAKEYAEEETRFERMNATTHNQVSITEETSMEEFFVQATLANRDFTAVKETRVVTLDAHGVTLEPSAAFQFDDQLEIEAEKKKQIVDLLKNGGYRHLPIPRRPHWIADQTTKEELEDMEKKSFLSWRRGIADLENSQSGLQVTPFEKNIQFWRQLWRVVERSDLLIQVVDARNPLLFRCRDLEDYVNTMPTKKGNFLLLNKADFLSKEQRQAWVDVLQKEGIPFAFFSAKLEQQLIDSSPMAGKAPSLKPNNNNNNNDVDPTVILSRSQLVGLIRRKLQDIIAINGNESRPTIGTVGYPNVGKSSVINVLCMASAHDHTAQRVSVSATPGHTKHFQTLVISNHDDSQLPSLTLCDCPGLVFPCFLSSKAEMLCFGILPIDEIRGRDWVRAIELVCEHVSKESIEALYSINLGNAWSGQNLETILTGSASFSRTSKLIETFCIAKGFWAGGGNGARLDEGKAARLILKDVVAGKLVWCEPPQNVSASQYAAKADTLVSSSNHAKSAPQYHFFNIKEVKTNLSSTNKDDDDDDDDDDNELKKKSTEDLGSNNNNNNNNVDNSEEELPLDIDAALAVDMEDLKLAENILQEVGINNGGGARPAKSKRLLRHGKKHRKARDVEPYAVNPLAGATSVGKFGKTNVTRKDHPV